MVVTRLLIKPKMSLERFWVKGNIKLGKYRKQEVCEKLLRTPLLNMLLND